MKEIILIDTLFVILENTTLEVKNYLILYFFIEFICIKKNYFTLKKKKKSKIHLKSIFRLRLKLEFKLIL